MKKKVIKRYIIGQRVVVLELGGIGLKVNGNETKRMKIQNKEYVLIKSMKMNLDPMHKEQ